MSKQITQFTRTINLARAAENFGAEAQETPQDHLTLGELPRFVTVGVVGQTEVWFEDAGDNVERAESHAVHILANDGNDQTLRGIVDLDTGEILRPQWNTLHFA